ncbi:transcription factor Tfb4 [Neoconidiobolus thromboides FSU 785]|nr:transcription factor Tfb4 [Neoconidiobolus thromboides FSU 785]
MDSDSQYSDSTNKNGDIDLEDYGETLLKYETSSLLVIVIDLHPFGWNKTKSNFRDYSEEKQKSKTLYFKRALEQILVFINAFLASSHNNQIALIAAHPKACEFIYPSQKEIQPEVISRYENCGRKAPILEDGTKLELSKCGNYFEFKKVNIQIQENLDDFIGNMDIELNDSRYKYSSITAAISKALCYTHQKIKEEALNNLKSRILILSVSPDPPHHYIPMMNSIFSAQRMNIPLDIVKLAGEDSVFLQQGAHISGGQYLDLRPDIEKSKDEQYQSSPISLLQHLLFAFLPEHQIRDLMVSPCQPGVDFRASCFCHKNVINIGFVCSICLSIYCQYYETCNTCSSRLSMNRIPVNINNVTNEANLNTNGEDSHANGVH